MFDTWKLDKQSKYILVCKEMEEQLKAVNLTYFKTSLELGPVVVLSVKTPYLQQAISSSLSALTLVLGGEWRVKETRALKAPGETAIIFEKVQPKKERWYDRLCRLLGL